MSSIRIAVSTSNVEQYNFWSRSPDASIFSHPEVLTYLVSNFIWINAYCKEKVVCMWPVCISGLRNGGISRFIYYTGPLWDNSVITSMPHQRMLVKKDVYAAFIKYFRAELIFPEFSLAIGDLNVRELVWACQESDLTIQVSPKCTAILNLEGHFNHSLLTESRKSDLRKFSKCAHYFSRSYQCEAFEVLNLYKSMFIGNELFNEEIEFDKIQSLCMLVTKGHGYMVCYRNRDDELVAVSLLLCDRKNANLVLNLISSNVRETGIGTKLIVDSIDFAISVSLQVFDFNGANSPNRAFFKHSFGSVEQVYCDIIITD